MFYCVALYKPAFVYGCICVLVFLCALCVFSMCLSVCAYVFVHVYMCVCVLYVCMRACVSASVHLFVCVHIEDRDLLWLPCFSVWSSWIMTVGEFS